MRLIDANAFLKRNEVYADCEFIHPMYQNTLREIVDDEPTIPATRWVRCEEPPKEDGWYMLCYLSRWINGSWWIPNFPDYWTEPPKEDA